VPRPSRHAAVRPRADMHSRRPFCVIIAFPGWAGGAARAPWAPGRRGARRPARCAGARRAPRRPARPSGRRPTSGRTAGTGGTCPARRAGPAPCHRAAAPAAARGASRSRRPLLLLELLFVKAPLGAPGRVLRRMRSRAGVGLAQQRAAARRMRSTGGTGGAAHQGRGRRGRAPGSRWAARPPTCGRTRRCRLAVQCARFIAGHVCKAPYMAWQFTVV